MNLEVGLAASFGAGVLSFLSPCILPLVPAYLCFLAGTSIEALTQPSSEAPTARVMARAAAFVLGFACVFVALGAGASAVGLLVSEHLTLLSRIAGLLIVMLGLHMLGAYRFIALMREARMHPAAQPAGVAGAFVIGLAFGFGWTPCVGPVLASILLIAGTADSAGRGAFLLAAYSAGIGVPFLAAALFIGPFLRLMACMRSHLGAIEKTMGAALVATGLLIFAGAMPLVGAWLQDNVPILGRIG